MLHIGSDAERGFALEEFRALNAEVISRVGRQNTFLGFALVSSSLIIPLFKVINNPVAILLMTAILSFVLWVILLVLAEQDYQIALVGGYIRNSIYPRIFSYSQTGRSLWEWHRTVMLDRLGKGMKAAMSAKYIFVGLPMIGIDLAAIPLCAIKVFPHPNTELFAAVATHLVLVVIRYYLAIRALNETHNEYARPA